MKQKLQWKPLLLSLAIPLAVGGLSAFLTKDGMRAFASLRQPPLSPPGWLFPVVWTLLYLMMGAACYLVWTAEIDASRRERALRVYGLSLAANFLWPILFFTMQAFLPAFLLLLILLGLVIACARLFSRIRRCAGRLLLPYIVWLVFAGYLNLGVWLLNR